MKTLESLDPEHVLGSSGSRAQWRLRLVEIGAEVGAQVLRQLTEILDGEGEAELRRDALSTRLMEAFRETRGRGCFGLLYELNSQHLLVQVAGRLRRYSSKADARDVLQEVFFNIYRYPHRFNSEREDAFRVWSAMIVRNTVLKHLRSQGRGGRVEVPFEDLSDQPEARPSSPLSGAIERESSAACLHAYFLILDKYLKFYGQLSPRERTALYRVEVEDFSYRQTADELGIKLENLKMVIFRARRKIFRAMRREFDGMSPDCRPARDPRAGSELDMDERIEEESDPDPNDDRLRSSEVES
ncbi:MAG: RNA polymerase sigma factor [Planctomycetota bacterium]